MGEQPADRRAGLRLDLDPGDRGDALMAIFPPGRGRARQEQEERGEGEKALEHATAIALQHVIRPRRSRPCGPSAEAMPRYIPGVLKAKAASPAGVTTITPPVPPSAPTSAITASAAAARALAEHPHPRADLVGDAGPDEIFAGAGGRDRAGAVVGKGAGADQRRIADPAPALAGQAAGRGRRGDMAVRRRPRPRRPCHI